MAYDIYAIGDARFLSDILNGVAAINNSSSFGGAIAVGFVIGVLLWGFQGIASGGRTAMPGAASIFAGLILFGVSYGWRGPVSSTVLVHNVYSGETYPVDHVPLGVAVTASTVSTIGYNMARLFDVPPGAFRPAPKVMSSIVRMVPRPASECAADDYALLGKVVTAAFGQRRKTLRNTLRDFLDESDYAALALDPGLRGEKLGVDAFVRIANHVAGRAHRPA